MRGGKAGRRAGPEGWVWRMLPMSAGCCHWISTSSWIVLQLGFVILLLTGGMNCEARVLSVPNDSNGVAIVPRILPQEGLALLDLRGSLRFKDVDQDWPHGSDPCDTWKGVRCDDGHVVEIRLAGLQPKSAASRKLRLTTRLTASSIEALQRLPYLKVLNGSGFRLSESLPVWLGGLTSLEVVDFRSASLTGSIPSSVGQLVNLKVLCLANNSLTGFIPSALGDLRNLTLLDLSDNLVRGSIPSTLGDMTELKELRLASNGLQGEIPAGLGRLGVLRQLLLAQNALVGDIPPQLANLLSLTLLDLSRNHLTGMIPANFGKLGHLISLNLAQNELAGDIPSEISSCSSLQMLDLSGNRLTGFVPAAFSELRSMVNLDLSSNGLSGQLPPEVFQVQNLESMKLSENFLSGPLQAAAILRLEKLALLDLSGNFLSGTAAPELLDFGHGASRIALLSGNCFSSPPTLLKRSTLECFKFAAHPRYVSYAQTRKRLADVQSRPSDSDSDSPSNVARLAAILGGVVAVLLVIGLAGIAVYYILQYERKLEARRRATRAAAAQKSVGKRAIARRPLNIPSGRSINIARLGEEFSYAQLEHATAQFDLSNMIMAGHTGHLYQGVLNRNVHVVIKKIDVSRFKKDMYISELEFFGRVSHSRIVPLLGHCLEHEEEKLLVYKYMPNGDLAYALHRRDSPSRPEDVLQSLDWITRLKIAIGVAEGLEYLHHECSPPLVHRDVKASSILLDDKFEVRLGSLTDARIQQGENQSSRIGRLLRLSRSSDQLDANLPPASCSYDVFCFGKVLLELVSGKLGISGASDPGADAWLDWALPLIDIHDREPLLKLMDKSLIVDEDLMEEVWATAIIAKSCLNPKSSRRPNMKHILRALENPQKVVRDDHSGPMKSRHSSYGSLNSALFGGWKHASSEGAFGLPGGSVREEQAFELNGRGQTSGAGEEATRYTRRQSGESSRGPAQARGAQSYPSQPSHESDGS